MTSGPALGLALSGPDAIRTWRELIGPTKAYRSAWENPGSLRAELGIGDTRNGFHGSGRSEYDVFTNKQTQLNRHCESLT